ncbi:MAG: hypothetical protein J7L94_04120 [Caldisericaceae bacterium]|nr:hypothetical protein [Caldisericaceae bacterium]
MLQFKIKVKKPIKGIEPQIIESGSSTGPKSPEDKKTSAVVEAQKIKILKDRIKILELELQKAREESFKAGYEEGKQNTLRVANERIAQARNEIERVKSEFKESLEKIEKPLLELAKKMASKVLDLQLSLTEEHDQILLNQLRKMLQEVQNEKNVTVEVHPEQLPDLQSTDIKEALRLPKEMEMTFVKGKNLKKGEAFISTDQFYVDGKFNSQIEELANQLMHEDNK